MSDAVNPKAFPLATPELTVSILEIVQQVFNVAPPRVDAVFLTSLPGLQL
jgi:hypothetical protein